MRKTISVAVFLALAAGSAAGADGGGGLSLRVAPAVVWAVPGDGVVSLSFDLLLRNDTERAHEIRSLAMVVRDGSGAFVTSRELNGLGMAPGIATLASTRVAPGETIAVFNPFHQLPSAVEPAELVLSLEVEPEPSPSTPATALPGAGGAVRLETTVRPVPARLANALRLPVAGKVLVWEGYDFYAHHRRFDLAHPFVVAYGIRHNFTRYGLDFMMADAGGRRCRGAGTEPAEYLIFGAPVVAPAAGVVVDRIDGRPDSPIGQMTVDYETYERTRDLRLFGGNFIVIDHGGGELSYLAHLQKGSVAVAVGDRVEVGQVIARVGNSGDSLEPHLHYQVLSSRDLDSDPKPPIFRGFRRFYGTRSQVVDVGAVDTGDVVESLEPETAPAGS